MENAKQPRRPRRAAARFLWLALVLVAVGAAAGTWVHRRTAALAKAGARAALFVVQRGPLTINITEAGTIQNRDQVIIKSEVEGVTTILSLVEEGAFVKKGDLLVALDSSKLADSKLGQEITVQNAEAGFIRATETLAVTKNQAESDVQKAELDDRFAKDDLRKYLEGEYPQSLQEAESKITIAKEELTRCQERFKWSTTLAQEKYLSQTDLDADRLAAKKADLERQLAEGAKDLLVKFTNERRVAELKSNVDQMRMALDRVRRKARADIVQADADLKAKDLQFRREKDSLEKIKQQILKCTIRAPVDAMVVYATTGRRSFRGNQEPMAEGQQVRERQELICLPTATSMMAEVNVHESSLEKVRKGMPARVTVDAIPGKLYTGAVSKIGLLPDAQMAWMNPDLKVYSTQVQLEGDARELRTGMTCRAEIIVEQYDDAVYVPIQAVVRVHGQAVVYRPGPQGPEMHPVTLGLDNNRMVRILSGLEAGEEVLLTPPLEAATQVAQQKPAGPAGPTAGGGPAQPSASRRPGAEGATPASLSGEQAARTDSSTRAARPEADDPASNAQRPSVQELVKRMEGMSRDERRQFLEGLPQDQREQVTSQLRAAGRRPGGERRRPGGAEGSAPAQRPGGGGEGNPPAQ